MVWFFKITVRFDETKSAFRTSILYLSIWSLLMLKGGDWRWETWFRTNDWFLTDN